MIRFFLPLVLLMGCSEPEPCPGPTCEDVAARKLAVLTACGVPAAAAEIDCSDATLRRLDCQVACMEAVECDALNGPGPGYLVVEGPYYDCLDACPGRAQP